MAKFGLPLVTESDNPLPDKIMAYISVQGKESVFGPKRQQLHRTAKAYHAEPKVRDGVRRDLEKSGAEIVAESALGMSVYLAPVHLEELTGGRVVPKERLIHTANGVYEYVTFLDI